MIKYNYKKQTKTKKKTNNKKAFVTNYLRYSNSIM